MTNPTFHEFTDAEIADAERASAEAAKVAPHDEVDSTRFFYHCEHRASNSPCPVCNREAYTVGFDAKGEVTLVVKQEYVKPEDWLQTYSTGKEPGISDGVSIAVGGPGGGSGGVGGGSAVASGGSGGSGNADQ